MTNQEEELGLVFVQAEMLDPPELKYTEKHELTRIIFSYIVSN
jgi:hypothetical protein